MFNDQRTTIYYGKLLILNWLVANNGRRSSQAAKNINEHGPHTNIWYHMHGHKWMGKR